MTMRALPALTAGFAVVLAAIPTVDFTMSVSPPPELGTRFKITWAPPVSGDVEILLHNLDSGDSSVNESSSSTILLIKDSRRFDTFWWLVPSDLCGRHSISLQGYLVGSHEAKVNSQVWDSGPCNISTAPATQTSTCVPQRTSISAEPNTFLIPNDDRYPYRVGQKSQISWVPSDDDTIDLLLQREVLDETVPLAENIPNTGSYEWIPSPTLANYPMPGVLTSEGPLRFAIKDSKNTVSTPSSFFYVLRDSDPTFFLNVSTWNYPTIGRSTTFLWSPSNDSSISLQLSFGNRQPLETIKIADGIPNTGSWDWNVPLDFNPGRYLLQGLSDADRFTGLRDTGFYPIVVGKQEAVECEASPTDQAAASQTASAGNSSAKEEGNSGGIGLGTSSWITFGGVILLGFLGGALII